MGSTGGYVIKFASKHVQKCYSSLPDEEKRRVDRAFQSLSHNPFITPSKHIKKLRGKFKGHYRWDINALRIIYTVDTVNNIVYIERITHRKDAYRK